MSAHGSSSTNWKTTESLRLRPDGDSPSFLASDEVVGFSSARIPNARWCVGPKQAAGSAEIGKCATTIISVSPTERQSTSCGHPERPQHAGGHRASVPQGARLPRCPPSPVLPGLRVPVGPQNDRVAHPRCVTCGQKPTSPQSPNAGGLLSRSDFGGRFRGSDFVFGFEDST